VTDDQLDGRDLDRAVAEAMGWTAIADGFYKGELLGRKPGCEEDGYLLPLYSTDPSTLPEMLAWFPLTGDLVVERCIATGVWRASWWTYPSEAEAFGSPPSWRQSPISSDGCTTVTESVARLIVAVAKAKKEQGK